MCVILTAVLEMHGWDREITYHTGGSLQYLFIFLLFKHMHLNPLSADLKGSQPHAFARIHPDQTFADVSFPKMNVNAFVTAPPSLARHAQLQHVCSMPSGARPAAPRRAARVVMHGPAAAAATDERRPGSKKGFVEEMRFVAMRLHTKDQAPSEGEQEQSAIPIDQWLPSHGEFMQFLVDSLEVYRYFEEVLCVTGNATFSQFMDTGLERVGPLEKDIAYLNSIGVETPQPTAAAGKYVDYMKKLQGEGKDEALLCHFYNYS